MEDFRPTPPASSSAAAKAGRLALRGRWALPLALIQMAWFSGAAAAEPPDAQRCFSHDPDVAIAGCTAMLQSGHETQEQISRAFSNRGGAYIRKGQYDHAIQDLDQAIRRDPNYALAFQSRGTAYSLKGQYERAIGDFNQAIRLDPNSAASFYGRGDTYNVQGQYERAIQDFDRAIRLKPDLAPIFFAATFHERGLAYAGNGQYDRALQDYDQAIRLYPNLAQAFYDRGAALRALRQPARAEADFAKARQLNPNLPPPADEVVSGVAAGSAGASGSGKSPSVPAPREVSAKSPSLAVPPEVSADDLRRVTVGMSREQLLKLGYPDGRVTMDDDEGHLIEIYQYSAHGAGLGSIRLVDGTVSRVQIR
jgi:tetratricopeptide (TPR) repeat protein